jgi:hypothetical protein
MAAGCTSEDAAEQAPPSVATPHLLALSSYSASLGTPIDAFLANPPPASARSIELVFDGVFTHADGRVDPVTVTQPTNRTEAGAVRWTTFGPFKHPFVPKDPDVGVFTGKVGVKVTDAEGVATMDSSPVPVRFEVKPSIVITELQPTTADCGQPALRLIGAMSYKLKAKAIGFKPTSIEYSFMTPNVVPDAAGKPAMGVGQDGKAQYHTTSLTHAVADTNTDATDAVDGPDVMVLPPVPTDRPSYGVVISVVARDSAGRSITNTFGMTAHKPLEVFYDGRFQLAQIYAPTPVSACMPGGQQGRDVGYSESQTETRQRQVSITLSQGWVKSKENNWSTSDGKTVTRAPTQTDGYSKTHGTSNEFNFSENGSTSTGVGFTWSDARMNSSGWTEGLEVGVDFKAIAAKGKVDARQDTASTQVDGGSTSTTTNSGWSRGQSSSTMDQSTVSSSTATTDSTAVTNTNSQGGSAGEQQNGAQAAADSWTVSSSETIQRGFGGRVIANTYGVFYRQMARYTRRAFVLEYNKCGEADVVGDLTMQDYIWAPDLALSPQCPPLPESNFPKPQCYVPPCDP